MPFPFAPTRTGTALLLLQAEPGLVLNDEQASVRASASVGARRGVHVAELGAVRKRHRHELSAIGAVPEGMDHGLDLHARREGLRDPTLPRQAGRSAHLDRPLLGLALRVVHG